MGARYQEDDKRMQLANNIITGKLNICRRQIWKGYSRINSGKVERTCWDVRIAGDHDSMTRHGHVEDVYRFNRLHCYLDLDA